MPTHTEENDILLDALGDAIEIGKVYGATRSQNGVTTVVIGRAKKLNLKSKTVSLTTLKRSSHLYGDAIGTVQRNPSNGSIQAIKLFPVNLTENELILKGMVD